MAEPYVVFQVAGSDYAVRSQEVQQVAMLENLTPVPNAPEFIDGVAYLRGQVIPVINLRKRFHLETIPYDMRSRLLVVHLDDRILGMAVDMAREFISIQEEEILPTPESLSGPGLEYLRGVVSRQERLILIVKLQDLLAVQEKANLKAAFVDQDSPD